MQRRGALIQAAAADSVGGAGSGGRGRVESCSGRPPFSLVLFCADTSLRPRASHVASRLPSLKIAQGLASSAPTPRV